MEYIETVERPSEYLGKQLETTVLRALGALEVLEWSDLPAEQRIDGAVAILRDLIDGNGQGLK